MKNKKEYFKMLLKAIFFSDDNIKELLKHANLILGIVSLAIIALVFTIPTDKASLSVSLWASNFGIVFVCFFALVALLFMISALFGAKKDFISFFSIVCLVLAASLIVISVPVLILSYFLLKVVLGYELLSLVLFSLVPYYNYIVFGFTSEISSELAGKKAIIFALISMTLIFLFNYMLSFIVA